MTTEWELDAAEFEEAQAVYSPTADDWAEYGEWLASQPEQLPTPEDFGPTAERAAEILAECGGDPFAD